jgi:hypothetical protein
MSAANWKEVGGGLVRSGDPARPAAMFVEEI